MCQYRVNFLWPWLFPAVILHTESWHIPLCNRPCVRDRWYIHPYRTTHLYHALELHWRVEQQKLPPKPRLTSPFTLDVCSFMLMENNQCIISAQTTFLLVGHHLFIQHTYKSRLHSLTGPRSSANIDDYQFVVFSRRTVLARLDNRVPLSLRTATNKKNTSANASNSSTLSVILPLPLPRVSHPDSSVFNVRQLQSSGANTHRRKHESWGRTCKKIKYRTWISEVYKVKGSDERRTGRGRWRGWWGGEVRGTH